MTGFLSRGHGSASDSDPKNGAVYENICVNSDFLIHSSCDNQQPVKIKKCKHNNILVDRKFWLDKSPYM